MSLGLGAAWCGAGCALQFSRRPSSGSSRRSCLHPLVRSRLDEAERCENLRQLKSMMQQCMYAEECIQLAAVAMQTLKRKVSDRRARRSVLRLYVSVIFGYLCSTRSEAQELYHLPIPESFPTLITQMIRTILMIVIQCTPPPGSSRLELYSCLRLQTILCLGAYTGNLSVLT